MLLTSRGTLLMLVPVPVPHWRVVEICDEGDADHSDATPFFKFYVYAVTDSSLTFARSPWFWTL